MGPRSTIIGGSRANPPFFFFSFLLKKVKYSNYTRRVGDINNFLVGGTLHYRAYTSSQLVNQRTNEYLWRLLMGLRCWGLFVEYNRRGGGTVQYERTRHTVFRYYCTRVGSIIHGIVMRFDHFAFAPLLWIAYKVMVEEYFRSCNIRYSFYIWLSIV